MLSSIRQSLRRDVTVVILCAVLQCNIFPFMLYDGTIVRYGFVDSEITGKGPGYAF